MSLAVHVTMCKAPQPEGADPVAGLDELDRELVDRYDYFTKWEFAYSHEHSTKTSTIGLVVSSSPAALLAWSALFSSPQIDPHPHHPLHTLYPNFHP